MLDDVLNQPAKMLQLLGMKLCHTARLDLSHAIMAPVSQG